MYEDKKKRLKIDWKELIIKLAILFVVVFLILWIISLVKGHDNKTKESNISVNLKLMKEAATEYFVGSKLPENVNGRKKVTLGEMVDKKLLVEFKDQDDNECSNTDSYAEVTKINDEDYTIKVKLVCDKDSDYVINTVSYKETANDETTNDNIEENTEDIVENEENSTNTSNTTKPSTNTSSSTTTTKPSTNNSSTSTSCKYGTLNYSSSYPLAYKISGCAVTKTVLYQAKHSDIVNDKAIAEYKKLAIEVQTLENKTGTNLYIESPSIKPILNKESLGYVGFQIKFSVKEEKTNKVIYEYYLNTNNNRVVVTDIRSSLTTNTSVTNVSLNKTNLTLYVGDTYNLTLYVSGTNNYYVSWSSSNTSVASVSSSGKITAKSAGTAVIYATVGNKTASTKITVLNKSTSSSSSSTSTVVKTETIYIGETKKLNLLPNYTGVLWESKDPTIAVVDKYGNVTGISTGRTHIYAYVPGVVSAPMPVIVEERNYIEFISTNIYLNVGETYQLRYRTNASTVSFGSNNAAVATVDKYGKVTAVKPGEATITIRANGQTDTLKVRVY